jgi:hypothetical protein
MVHWTLRHAVLSTSHGSLPELLDSYFALTLWHAIVVFYRTERTFGVAYMRSLVSRVNTW